MAPTFFDNQQIWSFTPDGSGILFLVLFFALGGWFVQKKHQKKIKRTAGNALIEMPETVGSEK